MLYEFKQLLKFAKNFKFEKTKISAKLHHHNYFISFVAGFSTVFIKYYIFNLQF